VGSGEKRKKVAKRKIPSKSTLKKQEKNLETIFRTTAPVLNQLGEKDRLHFVGTRKRKVQLCHEEQHTRNITQILTARYGRRRLARKGHG